MPVTAKCHISVDHVPVHFNKLLDNSAMGKVLAKSVKQNFLPRLSWGNVAQSSGQNDGTQTLMRLLF